MGEPRVPAHERMSAEINYRIDCLKFELTLIKRALLIQNIPMIPV